jgi:thioredoxin 1
MAELLTITEQNFEEEVLKSPIPVMIDFWAEWCGPCKMIGPTVKELAEEYSGKLKVGKLDVDANGAIAQKYRILSIPTLLFIKNGEVVSQMVGAAPKKEMIKYIDKVLA